MDLKYLIKKNFFWLTRISLFYLTDDFSHEMKTTTSKPIKIVSHILPLKLVKIFNILRIFRNYYHAFLGYRNILQMHKS